MTCSTRSIERRAIYDALCEPWRADELLDREFADTECAVVALAMLRQAPDVLAGVIDVGTCGAIDESVAALGITKPNCDWFRELIAECGGESDTFNERGF